MSKTVTISTDRGPAEYHVHCNYHRRPLVTWYDLTEAERSQVDYAAPSDPYDGPDYRFVRYNGWVYDINDYWDVQSSDVRALGFNGIQTDSYFSGTVVRWFDEEGNYMPHEDGTVIIGRIHW